MKQPKKLSDRLDKAQEPAVKAALKALKAEGKALVQMATGTGKTNVAIKVYKELERKNRKTRILWLTHTNELVEQSAERFQVLLPGVDVSLFYGKSKDTGGQVVIASVQSLSKQYNLGQFSKDTFTHIFVDEAHHTPAATWDKVLNNFTAKRFGFTATPYRPDAPKALEAYFGPIISEFSLEDAQEMGVVAKIEATVVLTNSVIEPKFDTKGDYTRSTLDRLWSTEDRSEIIVKSYIEYGRKAMKKIGLKYKTICYCVNGHHAAEMVKLFNEQGIAASLLVGDAKRLKNSERETTYSTFLNTHDIEILCVVNILNEGADINDVGCMLMCRPTKSNIVYTQQVGRGVRIVPNYKEKVVLIDFVDNTERKYSGYTAANLPKSGISHREVVTRYLKEKDPVVIERRVEDVMKSVREFEDQFRHPAGYWTETRIFHEAKKYMTRWQWQKVNPSSYQRAVKLNILDEASIHMTKGHDSQGRKDKIKEFYSLNKRLPSSTAVYANEKRLGARLQGYCSRSSGTYDLKFDQWARAKNYGKSAHPRARKSVVRSDGKIFESITAAAIAVKRNQSAISEALGTGGKSGGYHWAYCDENGKPIKNKKNGNK